MSESEFGATKKGSGQIAVHLFAPIDDVRGSAALTARKKEPGIASDTRFTPWDIIL